MDCRVASLLAMTARDEMQAMPASQVDKEVLQKYIKEKFLAA